MQGAIDAIEDSGTSPAFARMMQALPPTYREAITAAIAAGRLTPDQAMRIILQLLQEEGP